MSRPSFGIFTLICMACTAVSNVEAKNIYVGKIIHYCIVDDFSVTRKLSKQNLQAGNVLVYDDVNRPLPVRCNYNYNPKATNPNASVNPRYNYNYNPKAGNPNASVNPRYNYNYNPMAGNLYRNQTY